MQGRETPQPVQAALLREETLKAHRAVAQVSKSSTRTLLIVIRNRLITTFGHQLRRNRHPSRIRSAVGRFILFNGQLACVRGGVA